MRFVIITTIFVLMAVGDVTWWRQTDRWLRPRRGALLWRPLAGIWAGWMLLYLLLIFLWPNGLRRSESPVPTSVHAAVYLWHLLVLPWAVALLPATQSVIRLLERLKQRQSKTAPPLPVPETATDLPAFSRRQLLGAAAIALPPVVTSGLVVRAASQLVEPPRVRRIELTLPTLPADLDGMTIAHVTDLHIGKFIRSRVLGPLADQINSLRTDFIAMTGDLIDMSMSDLPSGLDFLNRLNPGHGLIVCEGNHDLMDDPEGFESRLGASGHTFLADSDQILTFRGHPLQFLGIRWDRGDKGIPDSMAHVRGLIRPDTFPILLAHHPHAFDATEGLIPLTLAGHTHGGQLMLTKSIGAGSLLFRYWSGLYRRPDSALVVSNGVGAWFPLRINAPAEIIHLTLHSGHRA